MTTPLAVLVLDHAGVDEEEVHAVCCDPNTALCGLDVTDMEWGDGEQVCHACEIAALEGLPCASPTCPERTR